MERIITVSLTFDYYPDTDHDFLFEGMTPEQCHAEALRFAVEDSAQAEPRQFVVKTILKED